MANFKYAIAALFFAASISCLALWWRSMSTVDELQIRFSAFRPGRVIAAGHYTGYVFLGIHSKKAVVSGKTIDFVSEPLQLANAEEFIDIVASKNRISAFGQVIYFPLWYAALVFVLAGVGVLRLRRQFSIRSAMIVLAAVAGLLGMVVAL